MANIAALIAKLRRERPELNDEPLLDEIELAAGGEPEADPMADAEAPPFGDDVEAAPEPDAAAPEFDESEEDPRTIPPGIMAKAKRRGA